MCPQNIKYLSYTTDDFILDPKSGTQIMFVSLSSLSANTIRINKNKYRHVKTALRSVV